MLKDKTETKYNNLYSEVLTLKSTLENELDAKKKELQIIETSIDSFEIVSQTSKRIEVKAGLSYSDKRIKSSGEIISETTIPSLRVTYILGREKKLWQLVDYISGM